MIKKYKDLTTEQKEKRKLSMEKYRKKNQAKINIIINRYRNKKKAKMQNEIFEKTLIAFREGKE